VRSWQTKDGLPQNTINALAQTRDGYLWVGTSGGLARFDGVRFRTFGLQDGLRSVRISTLLEDSYGVLWVGATGGGVSRWENGRFVPLAGAEDLGGADVIAMVVEPDGTLWIATQQGLLRWKEGVLTRIGPAEGLPAKQVRALCLDSKGALWVSILLEGVFRGKNGQFTVETTGKTPRLDGVYSLFKDRDGCVWAGTGSGALWQWRDESWKQYQATNGPKATLIEAITQGQGDEIWAGTRATGMWVWRDGDLREMPGQADLGLAAEAIRRLLVDRDGTLWVGTVGAGLQRVSRRMVQFWGFAEALRRPLNPAIAEDSSGEFWVGSQESGLYRFPGGRPRQSNPTTVLKTSAMIYAALATDDGGVWMAGEQTLLRFQAGEATEKHLTIKLPGEAVRALCADGTNLWLGTYYSTLLKCQGTNLSVVATNGAFGGDIRSIVREAPDTLWIGSASGVFRWERGQVRVWNTRDGLLTASVQSLHREPDGTVWIGTLGGGLARLKNGKIANITTRQGLIDDVIASIMLDDFGHIWLGCNRGIMRLDRKEIDDCAEGRTSIVHPIVVGQDEGMVSEQCVGGHAPISLKTRDGRLLFSTARGLVEIDPRRWAETTRTMPQASIEELVVDGQVQNPALPIVIPPGQRRFEVGYTAPSLRGGDWARFRFRLEPLEENWVNVGGRRRAIYPRLRPGQYVFRVTACNNLGVWNEETASVSITVQPRFWQTWWFESLAVLTLAGAVFAGYRRRVVRLERSHAAQEAITRQIILSQENERKRVASELHDGLNQNLALLSVEMEMFAQRLPGAPGDIDAQLKKFSQDAKALSAEVHRISHGLHPAKLTQLGLAVALRGMCREVDAAHGVALTCETRDVPPALPEELAQCLYRVAQEAIQNIVKHSGAKVARVELVVANESIKLNITDNGRGFEVPADRGKASLGLVSMNERIRLVKGEFVIWSRPGEGTRVEAIVPLPNAAKL